MSSLLCTSCGRMSKQMSFWASESPSTVKSFIQDLSPCPSAPVGTSKVPSKAAAHGTVAWAQWHGHRNFGRQHPSPTLIPLPTWVLLDLWLIKSQECQMSVWELSSLSSCDPSLQQYGKGRILKSSNPHDETCSQSSCQEAISQHELTWVSQAQQIGWAHCFLQVLCERVKHYCLNLFVCFKDSRLFRLLLINMALVRCCSSTNKASLRGKRLHVKCQS